MGQHLPPEDLPSGRGLIAATDEEVARDVLDHNLPGGPWEAGLAFHFALTHEEGAQVGELRTLVTPESLTQWGDFSAARDLLSDTAIRTRAEQPEPGVAYVKFVSNPGQSLISDGDVMIVMIMARACDPAVPAPGRTLADSHPRGLLPSREPADVAVVPQGAVSADHANRAGQLRDHRLHLLRARHRAGEVHIVNDISGPAWRPQ
jgi:hypothetical protein